MTEGAERGTSRYTVVSDLPDFTVHDSKYGVDLFPTVSGNRNRYCKHIPLDTAKRIADALNSEDTLTEALKVAGEAEKALRRSLTLVGLAGCEHGSTHREIKSALAALERIRNQNTSK